MNRRTPLIATLLAGVVCLLWAVPALAHALLVRSSPESNASLLSPPGSVEMWFSEPLEPAFSTARLVGPTGEEVGTGAVIVDSSDPTHMTLALGELDPGLYTVAWQTLSSIDGHEWYGSFPFTVLNSDGSRPAAGQVVSVAGGRGDLPTAGEALARWMALAPSMLIAGGTLIHLLVTGKGPEAGFAKRSRSLLTQLIWLSASAVVIGSLLQLAMQSHRLGGFSSFSKLTLGTRTGLLAMVRIMLGAVLALAAAQFDRQGRLARALRTALPMACYLVVIPIAATEDSVEAGLWLAASVCALLPLAAFRLPNSNRRSFQSLAIGSLALLYSFSASSHAGASQGSLFAVVADFVHLAAGSTWLSGLVLLTVLWWQTGRAAPGDDYLNAVRRFSTVAGAAVFVIVLSGLFSSLVQLPTVSALWSTSYGRVLLLKLTLVGLAFLVAYGNNQRVRSWQGTERLPRSISIEATLAVGVLMVVAVLVQAPTPRSLSSGENASAFSIPFNQVTPTDDLNVHVQVDPAQAGENRFWVHLYHDDGSNIGEVQLVRLFFESLDRQLGRAGADLEALGQDTFATEGAYLSQPGRWQIQVYVRRRGIDDTLSPVEFEVAAPPATGNAAGALSNPVPGVAPLALIGGLALVVGVVPFLWPKLQIVRFPRALPAGGALLIAFGVFGLVRGISGASAAQIPLVRRTNPIPPTSESIARGLEIYQQSCVICHGVTGKGDGPVGVTLSPRPSNFEIHMPPGIHTDGQLLDWISSGFPGSAMPAFGNGYSEDELWDVINYIRAFGSGTGP